MLRELHEHFLRNRIGIGASGVMQTDHFLRESRSLFSRQHVVGLWAPYCLLCFPQVLSPFPRSGSTLQVWIVPGCSKRLKEVQRLEKSHQSHSFSGMNMSSLPLLPVPFSWNALRSRLSLEQGGAAR